MTIEIQNEEEPKDYHYYNELEQGVSNEDSTNKVKRSPLEIVEEPPEGTFRAPSNDDDTKTVGSLPDIPSVPSMPSMPSIPQPPTMPSIEPKNTNTEATKYDVTTPRLEVEQVEATTEDYGNIGEPNCDYDPLSYILKCGINLITSIFGLSDTCCKPII